MTPVIVVVDSSFIVTPIVGVLCLVFALLCNTLCLFLFCNHLDGKKRAGCFTFIVFLMSCD